MNLTEKTVGKLKAPTTSGRQEVVCDGKLKGFGVLLSGVTNAKTYIAQRTVKGKTRRITIGPTIAIKAEDARKRAQDIIIDLIAGKDPKAKGGAATTVAEAFEMYVKKKPDLKQRSVDLYLDCSRRYLAGWSTKRLCDLTDTDVVDEHARIGETFGKGAANNCMRALRAVFTEIAGPGVPNPVQLKKRWFYLPPREGHVKGDDLAKFYAAVDALPNPVQRDYVKLVLFTGLRREIAAGLLWSDVDFSDGIIRLPARRGGNKGKRLFDVPMTDLVRDLLVARRAIGDTKFVFPSPTSKSGRLQEPKTIFEQIEKASGIKVSVHDLRRTYITAAERCVGGVMKKALVDHAVSDRDVTDAYTRLDTKEIAEDAQKVADRLRELCQIPQLAGANVTRLA